MARERTLTRTREKRRTQATTAFLTIVLNCDRPIEPGARFCLSGVESVSIGRAPSLSATMELGALRVGIPDPRMSQAHLDLELVLGSWMAQDAGSKNGTLVDGRRIERSRIGAGTIVEVGGTFLLLGEVVQSPDEPRILDGEGLKPPAAGFATFVPSLARQLERLARIAKSSVPVLLRGESGTGKEVLAHGIHELSGRPGPLRAINCGAIAPNLIESELFGHRRGAFSGAVADHPGMIRSAEGGTLLLDEVGDLSLPAQAALLRVMEQGEVMPVGGTRPVPLDVRFVAATNRDLDDLVSEGRFRADLLARLSGYSCALPLLRERREDFSLLVASLLKRIGATDVSFSVEAARLLLRYSWPLNVRELEKCLSSASALAGGGRIDVDDLPPAVRAAPPARSEPVDGKHKDQLVGLLRDHGGNVTAVAKTIGKARSQIQRWLRRYRIDPRDYRR
ncbi:MAG TPA: sigma 54-interacting transcriptional regulator [Myxococcales bacterium]|jgi:pSer/pThr/pTyr-binding forkhead associated (FHA) protein|nr:sigma 54-interacting transcriptional regulator [Myxococcales bacterium]